MSQQTGSYKIILDKEAFELLKETPVLNELNNHLKTQYQKYNN
jgi:predicted nucleic acid-binding protein